jgi:putative ABC transport system permease protein
VNEQVFRREGLGLADTVDLPGGALKVVGVYSDYGNPKPQVILSTQELVRRFPDAPRLRFGIDVAPARVPGLIAALRARFDLPETAVQDNTSIKRASVEVFERTFAVTRVLNVLTLAVAGLGMFASLMTLSGMRIAQIAPVWAMGVTKQRLAWLDLLRTIMLAVLTLVLAVPLGLLLAWILLSVVNVAAFGWKLPMYVFPMDWLQLSGLSFLVAGLAAIGPWQKLKKLSPADLLKVFANER